MQRENQQLQSDLVKAKAAYEQKIRTFIKLFFDFPTIMANMGYAGGPKTSGFCGSIATLISLYDIFGS